MNNIPPTEKVQLQLKLQDAKTLVSQLSEKRHDVELLQEKRDEIVSSIRRNVDNLPEVVGDTCDNDATEQPYAAERLYRNILRHLITIQME